MWSPSRPSDEPENSSKKPKPGHFSLPRLEPVPPPAVQRPLCLDTFSYDKDRTLIFDNSAMKYFKSPPTGASLQWGYEKWIKRPEERSRLDGLLQSLERDAVKKHATRANFVTWRGVVTRIITFPYEKRDSFDLNIMVISGVMYLEEHLTAQKLLQKEDMEPHHRLMSYYGYAFEDFCTSDTPVRSLDSIPVKEPRVDTNIQWCAVVRSKISDLRFLVGGEVDCVQDSFDGRTDTLVELKTSQVIRGERDQIRFRQKILKFWAQSFILGVPKIIVGFRTQTVKGQEGEWDAGVCLDFATRCIAYMKDYVEDAQLRGEPNEGVWRARFDPVSGVRLQRLFDDEVDEVVNGEDRVGFLPRWFLRDKV